MSKSILFLAHVSESGNTLPKASYEVLGEALKLSQATWRALDHRFDRRECGRSGRNNCGVRSSADPCCRRA